MSRLTEEQSPLLQFLDAFFQERNIKWMLGIGILILLGSSLMLVTNHWNHYTPVWKSLILLGYTAGIHALGQLCYHSLALRKTGTGLMALTVLLIPLSFLGLHWVHPHQRESGIGLFGQGGWVGVLTLNTAFSMLAARRIFEHVLRRPQPTFVVSYGLLAWAGAIVPALPPSLSLWTMLLLWSVFAIGATKVNRHVFWLTEERRLPRIYGFFPILLLGGMFLMLFASSLAPHVPVTAIGFGLVLTAVPVLLTADALAGVFQQRNPTLPRPLPWSLGLPILIGLSMTVCGVWLSAVGFPRTMALPPTAALATVVMAVTARRTQSTSFVWLMLAALLTAYQTSPVFFKEMARSVAEQGAAAIDEAKLPYAFYGLTYLPLLAVFSVAATILRRREETLFSTPLRISSIGIGLLLLLASFTHAKAMFPVGLALSGLFGLQLVLFRDRRLLLAGIGAFVLATSGMDTFIEQVVRPSGTSDHSLLIWTMAGGLLLFPGRLIDQRTKTLGPSTAFWQTAPFCQWASLTLLVMTASACLVRVAWFGHIATVVELIGGALLVIHAWNLASRTVGRLAVCVCVLLIAVFAIQAGWTLSIVMTIESLVLLALWMSGRERIGNRSAAGIVTDESAAAQNGSAKTLRRASADVAQWGLCGVALLYVLPWMALTILLGIPFSAWITVIVSLLWTGDAARRRQSTLLTIVGWLLSLGTLGVVAATVLGRNTVFEWYPVLATVLPLLVLGVMPSRDPAEGSPANVLRVLSACVVTTLGLVSIGSLMIFTMPLRLAGVLALVGLIGAARRWPHPGLRTAALSMAGWQLLVILLQTTSPGLQTVDDLSFPLGSATALPLALAAAWLSVIWNGHWMRNRTMAAGRLVQSGAFRVVAVLGLLNTVLLRQQGLSLAQTSIATLIFLLFTAEQLWMARRVERERVGDSRSRIRRRDEGERHVWLAAGIAAAGAGYLLLMGVMTLGSTISLFVPIALGTALWIIGRWSQTSNNWNVLSRPFLKLGLALPVLSVVAGLTRHRSLADPAWPGVNSLVLLMAAAFYFWRGLENRTPTLLIGSAAILNVASVLLFRELTYSDPQFFMIPLGLSLLGLVELLKPQIESRHIDSLRYIGTLTILVSPTFHIVEGSWLHLLSLMVASVFIALMGIGLRVRALMYAGSAFLAADLVAMIVRGSLNHSSLLWLAGILLGASVIGLAAYCERHREQMLQRVRLIAAELETWD